MPRQKNGPIRLDRASRSVVITCDECPHWSALRIGDDAARECAANHERDYHPERDQHQAARRQRRAYAKRHAADTPEMTTKPHGTSGR